MGAVLSLALLYVGFIFFKWIRDIFNRRAGTSMLNGPKRTSIFGVFRQLREADNPGTLFEGWAKSYGPAYKVPDVFGATRLIVGDPKASAHFYARETFGYVQTNFTKIFIANLFGRGLLWAEGESHRRQRKALTPAFSVAEIRKMTAVFYDSAYKLKSHWDSELEAASGEAVINVQAWMNHVALDSVGIAGFGHDFRSLDGEPSLVIDVFDSFGRQEGGILSKVVFLLGPVLPSLQKLPTARNLMMKRLRASLSSIADDLLERSRKQKAEGSAEEKSIIGLLLKAEASDTSLNMTQEEILAQNVLLLAGYETTSISLTWALIELCRKPEKQKKLREELAQFSDTDPTYDQLASSSSLPYLDAVVHEVLRLHPPISETTRVAAEDDVLPFLYPVTTTSGEQVTSLPVRKGTVVTVPASYMNQSEMLWGPTAKEFEPERWVEEDFFPAAKEISGHRHLLTFSDGPRICLGKNFALAEFKSVLSVLIRHYEFELVDGPGTVIEKHSGILVRPKVAGTTAGAQVPLRVRRID